MDCCVLPALAVAAVLNMGGKKRGKSNYYYKHSYQYIMKWKERQTHRLRTAATLQCGCTNAIYLPLLLRSSCKFCYNFAVYPWMKRPNTISDNGENLLTQRHTHTQAQSTRKYISRAHKIPLYSCGPFIFAAIVASPRSFLHKPNTAYIFFCFYHFQANCGGARLH